MTPHKLRTQITAKCIDRYGIDPFQKTRKGIICKQRQSIAYVLYDAFNFKVQRIADLMRKDRSTIITGFKTVNNELKIYESRRIDNAFWTKEIGKILDVISPFQSKVFDLFERLNVDESDRKLLNEIKIKLFYVE